MSCVWFWEIICPEAPCTQSFVLEPPQSRSKLQGLKLQVQALGQQPTGQRMFKTGAKRYAKRMLGRERIRAHPD